VDICPKHANLCFGLLVLKISTKKHGTIASFTNSTARFAYHVEIPQISTVVWFFVFFQGISKNWLEMKNRHIRNLEV
ncbi:MAG: hypothetical protein LBM70_00815, partial [Victivallales bacterium]|nr:hypothetical protein [Victivallales bacterium]